MSLEWDFGQAGTAGVLLDTTSRTRAVLPTLTIAGIPVMNIDGDAMIDTLARRLADGDVTRLAFLNAHCVNVSRADPAYRKALSVFHVIPDGIGVDIAAKVLYGAPFLENLNGTDFVPRFLRTLKRPLRVALVGGAPGIAERAAETLARIAPSHSYAAVSDGFFGEDGRGAVLDQLAAGHFDVVLVAMGVPAQERFIADHFGPEHGQLVIGVGALLDFLSGDMLRAPKPIRQLRLEWVWRLALEPRRLFRRYVLGNPAFLAALARDYLAQKLVRQPANR